MIAVSITVADPLQVDAALSLAESATAADLIEWRVDELGLSEAGHRACLGLVRQSPKPCILTCRHVCEGGAFDGDAGLRCDLIQMLAEAGVVPKYLDLEEAQFATDTLLQAAVAQLKSAGDCGLILSAHDFEGRPANLTRRVAALRGQAHADVVKIAYRARSLRDNLEAFDLLRDSGGPTIALCMGRFGIMSRLLAGKFGGLLTFAALHSDDTTAAGQPTLNELTGTYRFHQVGRSTRVYGIVGDPVSHSLSPRIHNAGFTAAGHDGVMVPMPVVAGWESFKATVASMLDQAGLDLRGLCVTLPHKQNLLQFVESSGGSVTKVAALAGAANTMLVGDDGQLMADNTDVIGVVEPLADKVDLAQSRVAVLGAGGAARAAVAGLGLAGADVTVFNRTASRADELVETIKPGLPEGHRLRVGCGGPAASDGFHVIVNATSVGMTGGPDPEASAIEALGGDAALLGPGVTVLETVYAPRDTPLVRQAIQAGADVITGDVMFLRQAGAQFWAFTGQSPPMEDWLALLG